MSLALSDTCDRKTLARRTPFSWPQRLLLRIAEIFFGTNKLSRKVEGLIAVNLAAVIFGSAALFGKLPISPFWIVAMRALFAAITLFVIGSVRTRIGIPPKNLLRVILSTGVLLAIHWVTFFLSVQWGGIAIATLTFACFPLVTVLIECRHAKRLPRAGEVLAACVIVVAVSILVGGHSTPGHRAIAGSVAGLVCAIAFAVFGIATKRLTDDLSPLVASMFQNVVVFAILTPFLPFVVPRPHGALNWLWLVLLGVITTALMHQLYFYALQRLSASTCSGFIALEPVYAIIFAAVLFRDPISIQVAVSAALIVGASVVLHRGEVGENTLDMP